MKTELKWGLIFSVAALLWLVLEYAVGLHDKYIAWHPILTNIFAIPAVFIMALAILEKRRVLGGQITFKQAFLCGLGVSVVVALLAAPSQWLFHNFINPRYFENAINYMVTSGKGTRELAENYFNLRSYMLQASVGALVMGTITSLILAAILRTRKA